MDFRQFLTVLRARWHTVVAVAVLGALLALSYSLFTTPRYAATAQLYVTSSGGDTAGAAYQGSLASQQRVQSYAELVTSRDLLQRVRDQSAVGLTVDELQDRFTAAAAIDTVLLDVTASDSDPARSQLLANTMGSVLSDYVRELETPAGGGEPLAKLTVVGPAAVPSAPEAPKTSRNVTLGLLAGIAAGIGLAVLLTAVDRRIKDEQTVERTTGAAVIGATLMSKDRVDDPAVPFRAGHSPEAEAYRTLRTNIRFLDVDHPPKVIVVTSSVPGEGKSTTTLNLGLVLVEAGYEVLIVEADLRRPRIAKYMGLRDTIGLTNVLSVQTGVGVEDVIQQTRWDGLSLLASGPIPPNPSELLGSRLAENAIANLREKYDFVLIDSPPVLPVTDASILSRVSDGILLVVRHYKTTVDQLQRTAENLEKVDGRILGAVMSQIKHAKRNREYYYSSYYDSVSAGSDERSTSVGEATEKLRQ